MVGSNGEGMEEYALSVGVDMGSEKCVMAVYDHEKNTSVPLELLGSKILSSSIALNGGKRGGGEADLDILVGQRAESRSAKRCKDVLCAHRKLLYCMDGHARQLASMLQDLWHFDVELVDEDRKAVNELSGDVEFECCMYKAKDGYVPVTTVITSLISVVCSNLLDAVKTGGALEMPDSRPIVWKQFGVSVPECFSPSQRKVVQTATEEAVKKCLGKDVEVKIVNESLAAAVQHVCSNVIDPLVFQIVDFGSSKLTITQFEVVKGDQGFRIFERAARTNVFVGGDELVNRLILWCEKRKPFQESLVTSKSAIFKLRKEIRSAVKILTVAEEAMIEVDSAVEGKDLALMLTLEDFERECAYVFDAVIDLEEAIVEALPDQTLHEIVLLGGLTRIPRIQEIVHNIASNFKDCSVKKTLDVDRAVALGTATICALDQDAGIVRFPFDPRGPYVELQQRFHAGDDEHWRVSQHASANHHPPAERSLTNSGSIGANVASLLQKLVAAEASIGQWQKRCEALEQEMSSCIECKEAALKERVEAEARAEAAERARKEAEARAHKLEEVVAALRAQIPPVPDDGAETTMAALQLRAEAAEKQVGRRERALGRAEADIRTLKEERSALLEILKSHKLVSAALHDEPTPAKHPSSPRNEETHSEARALPGEGPRSSPESKKERNRFRELTEAPLTMKQLKNFWNF